MMINYCFVIYIGLVLGPIVLLSNFVSFCTVFTIFVLSVFVHVVIFTAYVEVNPDVKPLFNH